MNRSNNLSKLKTQNFDLLIIGGGITGAGIALDAASRGLRTALVEKDDFASGTSSRSTKLVHGGLRYLKQLDIALVREVGRERAIVHKLAPHLVIPEPMLLPIIKGGTYGKLASNLGLWMYDFLAGVRKQDRRRMLNKLEALEKEPNLPHDKLKGAGLYYEYRTDDARLTIEIMKTASGLGATCVNYCRLESFTYDGSKINGGQCRDVINGETFDIKASVVVNATGPWVDDIRKINNSITKKRLHLTKGIHLVVDGKRFPLKQAIYFDVPDGRMIFAIPRHDKTYFGTTDTNYHEDKDHVMATREDAEYLLNAVNQFFPDLQLTLKDIESTWAGIRPLIHQEGRSASEISRKDEIFEASDGLISIAGGKLTGYRVMAKKTVERVVKRLQVAGYKLQIFEKVDGVEEVTQTVKLSKMPEACLRCTTDKIQLIDQPFKDENEVEKYRSSLWQSLKKQKLPIIVTDYLIENYGRAADQILEGMLAFISDDPHEALIRSELRYTVENEMVTNAVDFFERRSGRISFNISSVKKYRKIILEDLGTIFDWDSERKIAEEERLNVKICEITNCLLV